MQTRYCIIGGGIAGTIAAETIRTRDAEGDIVLISDEAHPLYSRVALPAYVAGTIGREKVMMRTASDYAARVVQFFPSERVSRVEPWQVIHRQGATLALTGRVETKSGLQFEYEKLLIASGGRAVAWPLTEKAPDRIFRLQMLDDAERLREFFERVARGHAVVIGGGFIALEFAEIFRTRGFAVTLIVQEKQFWGDQWERPDDHAKLCELWEKNGVRVVLGDAVQDLERAGDAVRIRTTAGRDITADCVAVAVGIERTTDFFPRLNLGSKILGGETSKLEVGLPSGIAVNEYLETAIPSVWAAGDVANCAVDGKVQGSRTWASAVVQGRIAGMNMAGAHQTFTMPPQYSVGHFGATLKFKNGRASLNLRNLRGSTS